MTNGADQKSTAIGDFIYPPSAAQQGLASRLVPFQSNKVKKAAVQMSSIKHSDRCEERMGKHMLRTLEPCGKVHSAFMFEKGK